MHDGYVHNNTNVLSPGEKKFLTRLLEAQLAGGGHFDNNCLLTVNNERVKTNHQLLVRCYAKKYITSVPGAWRRVLLTVAGIEALREAASPPPTQQDDPGRLVPHHGSGP